MLFILIFSHTFVFYYYNKVISFLQIMVRENIKKCKFIIRSLFLIWSFLKISPAEFTQIRNSLPSKTNKQRETKKLFKSKKTSVKSFLSFGTCSPLLNLLLMSNTHNSFLWVTIWTINFFYIYIIRVRCYVMLFCL